MKKQTKIFLGFFFFQLIILLPVMLSSPRLGHDMRFHLANIEVLSRHLTLDMWKQGFHIMPEMLSNLGYGIGIFYPILPHLVCAVITRIYECFHISSLYAVYTVYFFLSFGSSILVYLISKKIHKDDRFAIISVLIYTTMPYFLSNYFIRFALNEIVCIFFFLMVLLSLFYLVDKNRKQFYIFFIIGYIGMISSHLILTIFATVLLCIFPIIYHKEFFTKGNIKSVLIAVIIVSIWVLPDVILLFIHQLDGNYIVFQDNIMTSLNLVNSSRLTFNQLFLPSFTDWDVTFYIPIFITLLCLSSMIYLFYKKKVTKPFVYLFIIMLVTIVLMTPIFSWKWLPKFTLMIQFSWRLESFLLLGISIVTPMIFEIFKEIKYQKIITNFLIVVILFSTFPLLIQLISRIYAVPEYTVDNALGHQTEYLPVNFDLNHLVTNVVNGNSIVTVKQNEIDHMVFRVDNNFEPDQIILPKLFYYGYELKNQSGEKIEIERSNHGYIQATITENGVYTLDYTGTTSYQIFRFFRISMVIILILYAGIYGKRK